ncbi:MAG TPA: hypothetical protein VMW01_16450 [Williamwhitmania sp.]|nr:hypothetical protein [Williamwhitmania sp.]
METKKLTKKRTATSGSKKVKPHRFNSVGEIISDPIFIGMVEQKVKELKTGRLSRPAPKPGFYYKRDWYDRMQDEGNVTSTFFLTNIESIWAKKSSLSSEVRSIVQQVCERALRETLLAYHKLEVHTEAINNLRKKEEQ